MKKSLFALAALGAFATAAQAQSTVTLFGQFDSSIAYVSGLPVGTNRVSNDVASVTTAQTTGSMIAFLDGAIATSMWGMKGSEDLGGGMQANFYLESDILTNSGNTHSSGLFRRGANVSLADSKLGEVFLGRRGNAYILATGQMLPVQGNTAHQWRTVISSSVGDQISNSVTYATPTVMATNVVVQYGLNNTVENGDDGTMFAAHLVNKSINNLTILAAYNNQHAANTAQQLSAASNGTAVAAQGTNTYKNVIGQNLEGYAVGLKYRLNPQLEIGTFYAHGRTNNSTSATSLAKNSADRYISTGATGVGLGYQATSAILLGANYVKTTFEASMLNLQAHYSLSKRTRTYAQATINGGPKGNNQSGNYAAGAFSPVHCNSSTSVCADGTSSSGGSNSPASNYGYQVGVIHTF